MTEIDMGPSVAVALHHGAPLPKDGFSMVYIGSTTPVTSKSLLNHDEDYCSCLSNAACNDDSSGLPGTSSEFEEYGLFIDQRLVHSISRHPEISFGDESGRASVAQSQATLDVNEHGTSQGGNFISVSQHLDGYTNCHEENAGLYPNGRRKRVKASDLEEPLTLNNGPPPLLVEACGIADLGPSEKSHLTENTKWRNDVRQPEARRRRWAQADPLLDLWKAVSASKYAAAFRRPVALLVEYDGIVRQRMDLSTIRRRLENGLSCTVTELHRDLMLMLTNAVVFNKQGSEMFQMALKLKDHITKLFKVVISTKPNLVSHPTTAHIKLGSKPTKSKQQLPLPQDEFYNSGRSKDGASSPIKDNGDLRKALGDLPMAPFKKQRTARKPRLSVNFDTLGFQVQNSIAMEMDSSSEEEVAAMLICIRSGQGFYGVQDKGAVTVLGRKLCGNNASLLLAKQPKLVDGRSYQEGEITNQFEQAQEVGGIRSKSSDCSTSIHLSVPECSISELRAIEQRDKLAISEKPQVGSICKKSSLCPHAEMGTTDGHCQQRSSPSCKAASESPKEECQLTLSDKRLRAKSSWCTSGANILDSVGMDLQSRNVDTSVLITSGQSSKANYAGTSHLICSNGSVSGSMQDERGLDVKNEHGTQGGYVRSEKNCMGLKHKWQRRWQMQSAAISKCTASLSQATSGAGKGITRSISHSEQAGQHSSFDTQ